MTLIERLKILEKKVEAMESATLKQIAESDISNGLIKSLVRKN